MSIDFVENFTIEMPDFSKVNVDFSESFNSKHGLIIEVAAIHEGLTSNYNFYSAAELEKALQSWVEPYPKPIILNHDLSTEPIGRVMAAKMDKEEDGTPFVRLQIAITDPAAAQKVIDKRYLTGSVGGRAGKAVCSISGEDLAAEDDSGRPKALKYKRGKVYKGKLAYINMEDISFKEYSFVNQPADQKSGVRGIAPTDGKTEITASDGWIAKSQAFVLHMDEEEIYSLKENKSVLSGLKKKESRPVYLHLKGAFLSAMALQESETYNSSSEALLSNEDSIENKSEETHKMDEATKDEDILAVSNGLSEDLSNIAASTTSDAEESEKEDVDEEAATEGVADEEVSQEEASEEENSADDSEEAEVQTVDSENAEKPEEASSQNDEATQEDVQGEDELTTEKGSDEQIVLELKEKISTLEEENARLKKALHQTLVERVVDTKIALGLESVEDREKSISEHIGRTASSLADTLRDLAKVPAKVNKRISSVINVPEMSSEAAISLSEEDNVYTIDSEEEEKPKGTPVSTFEQVLVDALMGRRKL